MVCNQIRFIIEFICEISKSGEYEETERKINFPDVYLALLN